VSGGIAFARRRTAFTAKPGANEMVLGKKPFEVFVCRADVSHGIILQFSLVVHSSERFERLEQLERLEQFKTLKSFKKFKTSPENQMECISPSGNISRCYPPASPAFPFPAHR
jgi:hypothetical protein